MVTRFFDDGTGMLSFMDEMLIVCPELDVLTFNSGFGFFATSRSARSIDRRSLPTNSRLPSMTSCGV